MIAAESVEKILNLPLRLGANFAELYIERWRKRSMRVINQQVKEASSGIELGAGLRLFFGSDVVYAYTNDLSEGSLLELAETLAKLKGQQGQVDQQGQGGLDFRKQHFSGLHSPEKTLDSQNKRFRLERLLELDSAARIAPEIRQVEAQLIEWEQDVLVANSEGVWAEDQRIRSRVVGQAIAANEQDTRANHFQNPRLARGQ
ncbi:MAG: TldD/PmbA family protein [Chloroflexi bacterium AL-N5]|nr:TldD/PmbA family protein [Chloroflexi bacterium AL-N5]